MSVGYLEFRWLLRLFLVRHDMLIAKHMPVGPRGQKRPADVIAKAVPVIQTATVDVEDSAVTEDGRNKAAVELGRRGGKARAERLSATTRRTIAKRAAAVRWKK